MSNLIVYYAHRLCAMQFAAPYVLHGSLQGTEEDELEDHAQRYVQLLSAIRNDRYDFKAASTMDIVTHADLPLLQGN